MKAAEVQKVGAFIAEKFGRLDILVNNAGINITDRHWNKLTPEGIDTLVDGNLKSALYCITVALPFMRAQKDGLLIHTSEGEWIWRPLHNPLVQEVHNFPVTNVRGYGLIQRDRNFAHYQDIELNYEERPSYWIEPEDDWGEGRIELVELATKDETFDNIICDWPLGGMGVKYKYG